MNHYRYRRLDRIAEKKKVIPQVVRERHQDREDWGVGSIIRYSGEAPILIAPRSPKQIKEDHHRRVMLQAENSRRMTEDIRRFNACHPNRITDEMVNEDEKT